MADHESIWLEPMCCAANVPNGRLWCQDPLVDCQECGAKAIRFIRADIVDSLRASNAKLREALEAFARCPQHGKHGGPFVIAHAIYEDMTANASAPRQAYWHWTDFERARAALATAPAVHPTSTDRDSSAGEESTL